MADKNTSTLIAVGDNHPDRPHPDECYDLVRGILSEADIIFGQCEGVITDSGDLMPHLERAVLPMDPNTGSVFKKAGFTIMSTAGNHSMKRSNFLDTVDAIENEGIISVGLGKDIDEARKPRIIDINGTRVGFLAANAVDNLPNLHAGVNKPGTVPLKVRTTFEWIDHQPGIPPISYTFPNEDDLNNILEDIKKLRPQVDVLVWSVHWGLHLMPVVLADYEKEVAHAVIDAGADLILGHHAHLLKGIEVYKGKAVFYSMGNFVFDQYSMVKREDIEKYGAHNVPSEKIKPKFAPQAILPRPWNPDCPRFQWPPVSRKTMIVKCALEDKSIKKISIIPAYVNNNGVPEPVAPDSEKGKGVIEFLDESSLQFGLKLSVEGDEVIVLNS